MLLDHPSSTADGSLVEIEHRGTAAPRTKIGKIELPAVTVRRVYRKHIDEV
jgi:hypothetical protein